MKILIGACMLLAVSCNDTKTTTQTQNQTAMTTQTPDAVTPETGKTFYDFKMKTLDGKEVDFSKYKGKKVLVVNTASECGYTPQYKELQQLQEKHSDQVQVLAFPANNFGGQEPGSHEQIAAFCEKNYGVTFPVFEKISVKGDDMHPLYQWLSNKDQNGRVGDAPNWNFCKYLIDENGQVVKFYPSKVKPMSEELLADITK